MGDHSRGEKYTSAGLHPDGLLLGVGTDKQNIRLFDFQATGKEVAHLSQANEGLKTGSITGISFNGNGFLMATASEQEVMIWDLRKLKCIKSIGSSDTISTTRFDQSGGYLAIGSTKLS